MGLFSWLSRQQEDEAFIERQLEDICSDCEALLKSRGFSLDGIKYDTARDGNGHYYCSEIELSVCDADGRSYSVSVEEVEVENYVYWGLTSGKNEDGSPSGELKDFMLVVDAFAKSDPDNLKKSFRQNLRDAFCYEGAKYPKVTAPPSDNPSVFQGHIIGDELVLNGNHAPRYCYRVEFGGSDS